ncbi:B3 domain-containing protein [Rhynchospora pubera]|uniref:B3 domain-containing protein n=1 Tax=Rhynchospora pubera TaxID=906938 RepID=A0AAV8HTV7_9POAL|nr:B3 domain-containing protein [Rhynchospora pubera]
MSNKRARDGNPSEGSGGSGKPEKRGRGRPRKIVSSPVATPPPPVTEIPSSGTSFFKVFFPDTSTVKLRIPPAFCQQIDTKAINGTASLRGQSGHKWQVDLMQSKDDLYFESGWKDFVFDHSIQAGEILVFRYEGQSNFSVQVFDRSACEKESAFSAQPSKSSKGKSHSGKSVLQQVPTSALVVVKKEEPDDFTDSRLLMPTKTPEQPSYKRWLSHNTNDRSLTEVTKRKRVPPIVSQRRPVTQEEIDNTLDRAKSFESENPFMSIVMRNSYVYCSFFLNLPGDFVRENLPKTNAKLTLWDPTGKSWPVNYVCYNARQGALSGGWGKAAVGNNLEMHDVVVFELVKKSQLKMHIYRVVEEITPFKRACEVQCESRRTR